MARLPRLYVEGCPEHVFQRGARIAWFVFIAMLFIFFLKKFLGVSEKCQVDVHAFVLTNRFQLLVTRRMKMVCPE